MRGFQQVSSQFKQCTNKTEIVVPTQAAKNPAGYDWYCPVDIDISPQTTVKVMTGIKARLDGYSGTQYATGRLLPNGALETCVGLISNVIDLRAENTAHIKAGDRIMQGIFMQALQADSGNSDSECVGGVGSTRV